MSKFDDRKWRRELIQLSEGLSPKKAAEVLFDKLAATNLIGKQNRRRAVDVMQYMISRMNFNESVKEQLSEGVKENILKAIPDSYNYDKLAKDVADIIKEEYGSHNVKPFIKSITKYLK